MNITRENYCLKPYNPEEKHIDYVFVEAPGDCNLRCLGGNSALLFRCFEGARQTAMFAMDGGGIIRYSDAATDIILEYLGDGSFVCR